MKGQNIWKNWQVQTKIIKKLGWSPLLPHFLLWGKYVSESLHRFFCQQKSYEDSSSSVQLFLQNSCYGDVQAVLLLCISYISSSNKNTSYNPQMCYWYVLWCDSSTCLLFLISQEWRYFLKCKGDYFKMSKKREQTSNPAFESGTPRILRDR